MPQRPQQLTVDLTPFLKANFHFGRMHIDVDLIRRKLKSQKTHREATDHQQPAIGFAQCMLQGTVADMSSVEKQILHAIVAPAN